MVLRGARRVSPGLAVPGQWSRNRKKAISFTVRKYNVGDYFRVHVVTAKSLHDWCSIFRVSSIGMVGLFRRRISEDNCVVLSQWIPLGVRAA